MGELAAAFEMLAPFFGLIAAGYASGRFVRRPEGVGGLAWMQFFVVYVALPCLFFRLIADKPLDELIRWRFVAATTAGTALVFGAALALALRETAGDLRESTVQAVAASYANVGYMAPPLVVAALGAEASAPVILVFIFDNLLLFTLVPLLMSAAGAERRSPLAAVGQVLWRVATHPFIVSIALGAAAGALHLRLPVVIDRSVSWLSQAAAPTALFMLGLSVGLRPVGGIGGAVPRLVLLKLVGHPLAVAGLILAVGGIPPLWAAAAIVMAALPPALNLFVISAQYGVGIERASACVLLGTLLSTVTVTAVLWFFRGGWAPAALAP